MKILLVTSNGELCSRLMVVLQEQDYQTSAAQASIALDLVRGNAYDLLILDGDPSGEDPDGFSLCRQVRSLGYDRPILLLISPGSDQEAMAGFEAGANDYLERPGGDRFEPLLAQVLAQIQIWIRRSRSTLPASRSTSLGIPQPETIAKKTIVTWGPLSLDWDAARVTVTDQEVPFTSTEYKLLELFLRHPNRVFSRSAILDRLWDDEAPTERAINTYIKDIRKKLKTAGLTAEILDTIYGMGYRLKPFSAMPPKTQTPIVQAPTPANLKLAALAQEFRAELPQRLEIFTQAATTLESGVLPSDLHQSAQKEAHQLAGSLATFGYPEGSRLARSLEHLLRLQLDRAWSGAEVQQFKECLAALEVALSQPPQILESGSGESPPICPPPQVPTRLLVIDDDRILTEGLVAAGTDWGFDLQVVPDPMGARRVLDQNIPEVVLLDLSFPETEEDGLSFLADLHDRFSELPVVVFTGRNSLIDRLTSSRLGFLLGSLASAGSAPPSRSSPPVRTGQSGISSANSQRHSPGEPQYPK